MSGPVRMNRRADLCKLGRSNDNKTLDNGTLWSFRGALATISSTSIWGGGYRKNTWSELSDFFVGAKGYKGATGSEQTTQELEAGEDTSERSTYDSHLTAIATFQTNPSPNLIYLHATTVQSTSVNPTIRPMISLRGSVGVSEESSSTLGWQFQ